MPAHLVADNRHLLSPSSGGRASRIEAPAGYVPSQGTGGACVPGLSLGIWGSWPSSELLGLWTPHSFSASVLRGLLPVHLCVISPSYRTPSHVRAGPSLLQGDLIFTNYTCSVLFLDKAMFWTLGARTSTLGFGGDSSICNTTLS